VAGVGRFSGATGSDVTSGIFLFPLSPRPFLTKEKEERGKRKIPEVLTSFPVAPEVFWWESRCFPRHDNQ
jgi:hypothetical protein